ncbi:MAG: DNA polymerase Y family protein [Pseudomonadota bacterium]
MPTMLWVALHLPQLSLESWQAAAPPRRACDAACQADGAAAAPEPPAQCAPEAPAVLIAEHRVQHADAAALARGVRVGMQRATALALVPDLRLGQADASRDARALRAVAHVALGFSPSVAWLPAATADDPPALVGVRLEVRSCLRYWGGLPALLARLRAALAPLGHQVRIACAPTALGAALLAGWRDGLERGAHVQDHEALQQLLDRLPLHLLIAGAARLQALAGMGLRRLADVRRLPRDGLARRFGPTLLHRIDQARGQAPEAHGWLTLPPRFASRLELMHRADTSAQVLAGAQVLLARLVAWVQASQGCVARFSLVMHHGPRHRSERSTPTHTPLDIAPARPSADAAHLHGLLAERLGRLPLPAPVLDLSLHCDERVDAAPPNAELFGAQFASAESQRAGLARLVERLQARLGSEQVQRLTPVADYRPELGTCWQAADPAQLGVLSRGQAELLRDPQVLGTQPLWLLPAPQVLAERDAAPLLAGQPLQLLAGPERLECGWWDGALVLRDYFIAQSCSGALVWVYRKRLPVAADEPGWFLQGLFA